MSKSGVKKSDVVNRTGGIVTKDGRTLYGLDAETYEKMEAKNDPEFENSIAKWIESVTKQPLERPDDLWLSLKSGVVLCQLINSLRPGLIKKYSSGKGLHALVELENINYFLKACWSLGVPSSDLFNAYDLHSAKSMSSVLQTIASLSRIATTSLGYKGETLAPSTAAAPLVTPPPRHWEISSKMGTISQDELEDDDNDPEQVIIDLKRKLEHTQNEVKQLEREVHLLGEKNEGLQSKLRERDVSQASISRASTSSRANANANAAMSMFLELQKELESIRASSKETIKDLDQQCASLEQQVSLLKKENERLLKQHDSSQTTSTNSPNQADLQNQRRVNKELEQEIKTLTSKIAALQEESMQSKSDLANETSVKELLKTQIKNLEEVKFSLNEQIKTLTAESKKLRLQAIKDKEAHQNEIITLTGKHELELERLEKESRTKFEASEADVRRLQRLVENLQKDNRKLVATTAASSSKEKEKVEKAKKLEADELLSQLQEETKKNQDLRAQLSALEAKLSAVISERDQIKREQAQLNSKNSEALEEVKLELSSQMETLKAKFEEEKKELEEDNLILERRYQAAVIEARTLRTEAKKKEEEMKTRTVDDSKINSLEAAIEEKEQALNDSRKFQESLKIHIKSKDETIKNLESRMQSEIELAKKRGQAEVAQLKAELAVLKGSQSQLQESHQRLLSDLEKKTKETESLQSDLKDLQGTNSRLMDDLQAARQQRQSLASSGGGFTPKSPRRPIPTINISADITGGSTGAISPRSPRRGHTRQTSLQGLDPSLLEIKKKLEEGQIADQQIRMASKGKIRKNASLFYEKSIDESLLVFCKTSIEKIVFGTGDVVYDDMPQLDQLFKFDTGRRIFAFLLQFHVTKETEISPEAFEVLLYLLNACLTEMILSESQDYNTIAILMEMSKLLYQKFHGRSEYIKDMLRGHDMFQTLAFWEQRFLSSLIKQYKSKFETKEDKMDAETMFTTSKQKEFAKDKLIEWCQEMLWWGVSSQGLGDFLSAVMKYVFSMTENQRNEIIAKASKLYVQAEAEREKQIKKARDVKK